MKRVKPVQNGIILPSARDFLNVNPYANPVCAIVCSINSALKLSTLGLLPCIVHTGVACIVITRRAIHGVSCIDFLLRVITSLLLVNGFMTWIKSYCVNMSDKQWPSFSETDVCSNINCAAQMGTFGPWFSECKPLLICILYTAGHFWLQPCLSIGFHLTKYGRLNRLNRLWCHLLCNLHVQLTDKKLIKVDKKSWCVIMWGNVAKSPSENADKKPPDFRPNLLISEHNLLPCNSNYMTGLLWKASMWVG